MGRIRLTGATSGYTELRAASTAGNNTITLPTTNGGEVVVSDSSGNVNIDSGTFYVDAVNNRVGVGSNAPSYLLDLLGSAPRIRVKDSSTGAAFHHFENNSGNFYLGIDNSTGGSLSAGNYARVLWSQGAYPLVFATNDTQRAQIDSSGRLLVGTSSARTNIFNESWLGNVALNVEGANAYGTAVNIVNNYTGNGYSFLNFLKSNTTSVGSNTIVASGDTVGLISFQGNDGTEFVQAAAISAVIDATPGANDMPGRLVFSTTTDGASSPTLALKIDSNQYTYFSTNNSSSGTTGWAGVAANPVGSFSISRAGSNVLAFFHTSNANGTSGAAVGTVSITTTTTSYNTSSDYRLKENVTLVSDGITRLQQLKPSRFNFIADPDKTVDGFIAHEVQAVVPEAVTGAKDEVDADGNPIYQGIDQSKLVPLLTAALQETIGEVESLKARVAALESA